MFNKSIPSIYLIFTINSSLFSAILTLNFRISPCNLSLFYIILSIKLFSTNHLKYCANFRPILFHFASDRSATISNLRINCVDCKLHWVIIYWMQITLGYYNYLLLRIIHVTSWKTCIEGPKIKKEFQGWRLSVHQGQIQKFDSKGGSRARSLRHLSGPKFSPFQVLFPKKLVK